MKRMVKFGLVAALLSGPVALAQNPASPAGSSEQGKTIFVSRCAKCHDADANRKLPDGSTLLQRLAKRPDLKAALATRLKNEQERDAVLLYLQPLIDRFRTSDPGAQVSHSPPPSAR